jgi:uncharacterized membrane protein YeiH
MATMGRLIAAGLRKWLHRLTRPLTVLDAAGLSLFPVTGASNALDYGLGPAQAIIMGANTGTGGGTLRDVLARRIPVVLQSGPNAISAIIGAVSRSPPSSAARTEWPRRSRQRRSASSSGCSASPNGLDAPDRAA